MRPRPEALREHWRRQQAAEPVGPPRHIMESCAEEFPLRCATMEARREDDSESRLSQVMAPGTGPSLARRSGGRPPSSVRAAVKGAPMGWPSLEGKARHIPTSSQRDLGVPMAAPSSGTEVPCSPQSDESPKGDRPSPAGTTELAAAKASAGVAFATIAPLAPLERGGRSGVENSQTRYLTCNAYCSAVKHPCRRRSPSSRSPWASPAGAGPSELNAALISKARHLENLSRHRSVSQPLALAAWTSFQLLARSLNIPHLNITP